MTEQERKSIIGAGFLLAVVGGAYLIGSVPLPRMELVVWGLIFAVWAVGYLRSPFKTWHPELQKLYKSFLLLLIFVAMAYFTARLWAPVWVAIVVAVGMLVYFSRYGIVETILIRNKRYDEAHRYIDTLIKIFPGNARLYVHKAQIYLAQEHYEEAHSLATQAIDLIKSQPRKKTPAKEASLRSPLLFAHGTRLGAAIRLRDGESAFEDADFFVQQKPLEPYGYADRGTARLQLNDFEGAKADFEHALSMTLTPHQRGSIENSLGLLNHAMGDYDTALEYYVKVTQISYDTPYARREMLPVAYENMSCAHVMQNDRQAAWQAMRTAHDINPEPLFVRVGMATLHAHDGEWDTALALWREMVKEEPRLMDRAYVADRFYHWTPPLADATGQIIDRLGAR